MLKSNKTKKNLQKNGIQNENATKTPHEKKHTKSAHKKFSKWKRRNKMIAFIDIIHKSSCRKWYLSHLLRRWKKSLSPFGSFFVIPKTTRCKRKWFVRLQNWITNNTHDDERWNHHLVIYSPFITIITVLPIKCMGVRGMFCLSIQF